MPKWIVRRGKFFSECHRCRRQVQGLEESGYGRDQVVVKFRCSCREQWHKEKSALLRAARGGYTNGRGEWLECDAAGFLKPEVTAKIYNDSLGYGVVQVAKNLYFEKGIPMPEDMPEKFKIAFSALQEGRTEEEAQREVAVYLRSQ